MPKDPKQIDLPFTRSARVIDVNNLDGNKFEVTFLIGHQIKKKKHVGSLPSVGDIYLVSEDGDPLWVEKIGQAQPDGWTENCDGLRWRRPDIDGRSRMSILWQRHLIRQVIRKYFDVAGFIEIDTPLLVNGTTPDISIDSISVGDHYLIPSSEFQIKRLEVGGFDRIYTLTQNFRGGDGEGSTRNPEFTMLEWARVGEPLSVVEQDAERFIWQAHIALGGSGSIFINNEEISLAPPWKRITVQEAIRDATGYSVKDFSIGQLTLATQAAGISIQDIWRDDLPFMFSVLMSNLQPLFGRKGPVFIQEWPAFETSSAGRSQVEGVVDRSELFVGGIELSDGFSSLTDYVTQLEEFNRQNRRRLDLGMQTVRLDQAYLQSLKSGLPKGAGKALGFDRLVMVLTGCNNIQRVLAFNENDF